MPYSNSMVDEIAKKVKQERDRMKPEARSTVRMSDSIASVLRTYRNVPPTDWKVLFRKVGSALREKRSVPERQTQTVVQHAAVAPYQTSSRVYRPEDGYQPETE